MLSLTRKLLRRHFLSSMIPPFFLDCVFAIGLSITPQGAPPRTAWMATGFLVGQAVPEQKGRYRVFLVTCNHVIEGLRESLNSEKVRATAGTVITPLMRF